ncbi:Metallo-dependent hydrolase [Aspergillus affinis]|uniref:Metallo-dependent hydrolase n=1 Tax=Aspergillus affinis TaxID=1070780 RepID=UPI0022FF3E99|nr:Metallo-dependent hydrolase [Aspergillus affinis]KAI9038645.1 Metallo-dependent hydrolase [Aspergillus affinis]
MHVAMGHCDTRHARVVQDLADMDLLAPDLVFSHGASFMDGEIEAIARVGAGIVGTPDTELQMGMGYPVVLKARDAGCRMRLAVQTQRGIENAEFGSSPPATLKRTTADVLRMGTMGGAEVMHLENLVGSITPGKKVDLVLFRCDDIDTVPVMDPVGTVVFHTSPGNIDTAIVDGRIVKRDGKLVGVDWASLRHQVEERSRRIVAEATKVDTSMQREQWSRALGI